MSANYEINKLIPQEHWTEFFDQFSMGSQGRTMAIRVIDSELGDELLIQNAPLMAMVYDRPSKGDDLVIEVGRKQVTYGHTVYSPTEIWTAQDDNGGVRALLIKDSAKNETIVTLE